MMDTAPEILAIDQNPKLLPAAAAWFHSKWGIPEQAYLDSMEESLTAAGGVPRWYVVLDDSGSIAAGLGVIENDFHKRPDLRPNICAVYVEKPYRLRGLARMLLNHACAELALKGAEHAYLITDHTDFYEHCGWSFFGMIEENSGELCRMYHRRLDLVNRETESTVL
jgi:GNAT superfamily N-acetyltransferase